MFRGTDSIQTILSLIYFGKVERCLAKVYEKENGFEDKTSFTR